MISQCPLHCTLEKTRLGKYRLCHADEAWQGRNICPWLPDTCRGVLCACARWWPNHGTGVRCANPSISKKRHQFWDQGCPPYFSSLFFLNFLTIWPEHQILVRRATDHFVTPVALVNYQLIVSGRSGFMHTSINRLYCLHQTTKDAAVRSWAGWPAKLLRHYLFTFTYVHTVPEEN